MGVEDFGDAGEASFVEEVVYERFDCFLHVVDGLRLVAVDAEIGPAEASDEPGPDGALVIGGVAAELVAVVPGAVAGVPGAQRAEAFGGEELFLDDGYDAGLLLLRQGAKGQGDGEDLVGADGRVSLAVGKDAVVEAVVLLVPEDVGEALGGLIAQFGVFCPAGGVLCGIGGDVEGVDPEGVDFDGLAVAWGEGDAAAAGVHPGELGFGVAGEEEASVSAWMWWRAPL